MNLLHLHPPLSRESGTPEVRSLILLQTKGSTHNILATKLIDWMNSPTSAHYLNRIWPANALSQLHTVDDVVVSSIPTAIPTQKRNDPQQCWMHPSFPSIVISTEPFQIQAFIESTRHSFLFDFIYYITQRMKSQFTTFDTFLNQIQQQRQPIPQHDGNHPR